MRTRSMKHWAEVSSHHCEHNEGLCSFHRRGDVLMREQIIRDLQFKIDVLEEKIRRSHDE